MQYRRDRSRAEPTNLRRIRNTRPMKDAVLPEGTLIARTTAGPKIRYWGRNGRNPSGIERYGQNRSEPAPTSALTKACKSRQSGRMPDGGGRL